MQYDCEIHYTITSISLATGPVHNGTAVPRKNGVAWVLTYACIIEWPLRAARHSLGHLRGLLRTFSSLQASKVTTRELGFSSILERKVSVQIGEGLTCGSCVAAITGS